MEYLNDKIIAFSIFVFICLLFYYFYYKSKISYKKILKKRSLNEWKCLWRNHSKAKVFHICRIVSKYLGLPNSFIYPQDLFDDIFIHSSANLDDVEVVLEIEDFLKIEISDKKLLNNKTFEDFITKIIET